MRRARMSAACALVAVAGCGGGSTPAKHAGTTRTATQPARPSVEVALRGPDTRRVVFNQPLKVVGVVRPARADTKVTLLSSQYPYPVSEPEQATTTGEGGRFDFTVRPLRNTLY